MFYSPFWEDTSSVVLYNPRLPEAEQELAKTLTTTFPHLSSHVWIATSGSTHKQKWTALSKKALLASARGVNSHLNLTSQDRWLNPLPSFHVGGLSIYARAYLTQFLVFHFPWNPLLFSEQIRKHLITVSALVPTQIYDLVQNNLKAPKSIRAIVVGGGALSPILYQQAKDLGWPLLPSYGLTECGSQVATATQNDPSLKILPHIQLKTDAEGFLWINSPALLTGYAIRKEDRWEFIDPKQEGWLKTEDFAEISDHFLKIKGRDSDYIKIGGEGVSLQQLNFILDAAKLAIHYQGEAYLLAVPDSRLGSVVHLVATASFHGPTAEELVELFNQKVLPYEKIRILHIVDSIPKSSLGKILQNRLLSKLALLKKILI